MTKPEIVSWLLAHDYQSFPQGLASDNEPGWEVYASKARGRVVAVCDTEVVFVSGMFYLQGLLEHVAPAAAGDYLALDVGVCTPLKIRTRRSTFAAEISPTPIFTR